MKYEVSKMLASCVIIASYNKVEDLIALKSFYDEYEN